MNTLYQIGQIVPSSNVIMETEILAMLQARANRSGLNALPFTPVVCRMNEVSKDELAAMDGESDRCALELSDARRST